MQENILGCIKMKNKFLGLLRRFYPNWNKLNIIESELQAIKCVLAQQAACSQFSLDSLRLKSHTRYSDPKRLHPYGFKVNSQNAEDGMICEIFRRIGNTTKVFLEIGIGDGTQNNTAFLLSTGWTGYWLDGSATFRANLTNRNDNLDEALTTKVTYVTKENICSILADLKVPNEFDLLSLDIDQNTFHVWSALTNYKPRVVVIEYNSSLPADVSWVSHYKCDRVWDGSNNFGASLKALEELGAQMGYSLVGCDLCGVNAFFVRSDLVADKFCEPFSAENHYEPPRFALGALTGHPPSILDRCF